MGKKTRKTRWRTLTIADNEYSDSEESSTTTTQRLPKGYQPKSYYNKFSYSSQSTPRRRYQHDSTKSTRSSSTASETKITFNEDEYTKITTPRQDVLFKKGYLNKPKNYQTQTSTGTSTTSTGNSTGNGTPDHQSTDLEYESQFVFPNGFVDQNGIYYINSYETYPLMLYNPPTYYPEFSNFKSKRYSTGSLTESMSPNNEEATSQDLSGGEASNNVSDYSGHHQVYNMVYPGYYVNGVCPPHDAVNGESQTDQTRRIKKRRRRKTSKSQTAQDSSEYTEDEDDSCNEEDLSPNASTAKTDCNSNENEEKPMISEEKPVEKVEEKAEQATNEEESNEDVEAEDASNVDMKETKPDGDVLDEKEENSLEIVKEESVCTVATVVETEETIEKSPEEGSNPEVHQTPSENTTTEEEEERNDPSVEPLSSQKSELKPDAEEFIPRAFRSSEVPMNQNMQFIKVPPNFIPIPIVPLGDFNGQNYNPAFIPPGIPINFLPPDPKMYPNFVGFVPNPHFVPRTEPESEENQVNSEETINNKTNEVTTTCDKSNTAKEVKECQTEKVAEKHLVQNVNNKTIDIATIVSKLEEAAKEQDKDSQKSSQGNEEIHSSPRRRFVDRNRTNQKYKNIPNYRRPNYNSTQNSPQRNINSYKEKVHVSNHETPKEINKTNESCPEQKSDTDLKPTVSYNGIVVETKTIVHDQLYPKRNLENHRKNWKYQTSQNATPKWQPISPIKGYRQNGKPTTENIVKDYKPNQSSKNYSAMLKNKTVSHTSEQKQYERQVSEKSKHADELKEEKKENNIKTLSTQPKQSNQWISVSSRKKRKNKTADEAEISFEQQEDHSEKDLFEKYDVDQLVDVIIPQSQEEDEIIKVETTEEIEIGDIINTITQNEASLINNIENISLNLTMRSVDDIEKELIVKETEEKEELTIEAEPETVISEVEIITEKLTSSITSESLTESDVNSTEQETTKIVKNNKKSKKGCQKAVTKRVIITDVDLSMKCEEIKTPVKKIVTKLSEKPNETVIKEVPTTSEEKVESQIEDETPKNEEEEEKKKIKKKKKKQTKTTITNSLSSSNATINNADDSYDFLLDSALSEESVEKTNVEISHELDKIIQKGMYSSLEEKIKSLNIDDDSDGFFKSVFSNISSTTSTSVVDKNGFNKTPDLSKILQDSRSLFRPSSVSQENNSHNRDINRILPDLDSPAEDGIFLEKPKHTDDTSQGQTETDDKRTDEETRNADPNGHQETNKDEQKKLYPITEAVKEWLSKTRETTPDVEILKSPDAIFKEFCDSESETDTVVSDCTALGDEEVIIFAKGDELDSEATKQNLMESWEDDLGVCETNKLTAEEERILSEKYQFKAIEQGEDALEAYESKNGKNEDYLNLQKEVKDRVRASNQAKPGNLPYRAICCSIM